MLLSFSRGSIIAAAVGRRPVAGARAAAAARRWPCCCRRDRGRGGRDRLGVRPERAHRRPRGARRARGLGHRVRADPRSAMAVVLFAAGLLIERRARDARPLSAGTRRTLGKVALGSLAAVPLIVLAGLAFSDRGIGGTVSDRWDELTNAQKTPQNDPGRLIEAGNVRTIYWARAIDVWQEHEVGGAGRGLVRPGAAALPRRAHAGPPRPRVRAPDARRPRSDRSGGEPRRAGRLAARDRAPPSACARRLFARRLDAGANRPAGAGARGGRLRRALGARLDLVRAGRRDDRPVLRRLGRRPRAARRSAARRAPADDAERPAPGAAPRCSSARGVAAVAVLALAVLSALAVAQPWRADQEGDEALRPARQGRHRRRAGRGRARERHQPAVGRAVLRARRDRGRRRPAPARADARSRTPCASSPRARRRGGGSASTTRSTSTSPRARSRSSRARVYLDPASTAEPQRLPRGATRPRRGRGRARGRRQAARKRRAARRAAASAAARAAAPAPTP